MPVHEKVNSRDPVQLVAKMGIGMTPMESQAEEFVYDGDRVDDDEWDQTQTTLANTYAHDFTRLSGTRDQSNLKFSPEISPTAQKTITSHHSLFSNVRSLEKTNSSARKLQQLLSIESKVNKVSSLNPKSA